METTKLYTKYEDTIRYIFPFAVQAFSETKVLPSIAIGTAIYFLDRRVITVSNLTRTNNIFNTTSGPRSRLTNYASPYYSIIEKYKEINDTIHNEWFASYKDSLNVIFKDKPNTIHDIIKIIDELGLKEYDKLYIKEYIRQMRENGMLVSEEKETEATNDVMDRIEAESAVEASEIKEVTSEDKEIEEINSETEEVASEDKENTSEEEEDKEDMKDNIIEADTNVKLDREYWYIEDSDGRIHGQYFCLAGAIKAYNNIAIRPDMFIYVKDKDGNIVHPKDAFSVTTVSAPNSVTVVSSNENDFTPSVTRIYPDDNKITILKNANVFEESSITVEDDNIHTIYVKNINVYKNPTDKRPFRSVTGNYYIMGKEVNNRTLLVRNMDDISPASIVGWVKSSKL